MKVCVDASVVLKLFINEPLTEKVNILWERWVLERAEKVVPSFFTVEIISALRRLGRRRLIAPLIEERAIEIFLEDLLPSLEIYELNPQLLKKAWKIAKELDLMHIYDTVYIALAEEIGCNFWTADYKLYNLSRERFPFVKCIK